MTINAASLAQVAASTAVSVISRQDIVDVVNTALTNHANLTTAHGAVTTASANRMMIRDGAGRSQVATPAAANDVANKAYVDGKIFGPGAPLPITTAGLGQWGGSGGQVAFTLPPGGTWAYFAVRATNHSEAVGNNGSRDILSSLSGLAGIAAGGTVVSRSGYIAGFYWRIK